MLKAETLKYIFVFDISSFRFQRLGVSAFAFKLSRLFGLLAGDIFPFLQNKQPAAMIIL
jgi:hypothetical protein